MMNEKLFPYQKEGVAHLIKYNGGILGDEMGLGKTVQAIEFCRLKNADSVLIICPANLLINWYREVVKWGGEWAANKKIEVAKSIPKSDKAIRRLLGANILIMNYAKAKSMHWITTSKKWGVLICDEAHYLKNLQAQRTQYILGNRNIEKIEAESKIFITGTPYKNSALDVYPLANALKIGVLGKYVDFRRRYVHHDLLELHIGNGRIKYVDKYYGVKHEDELVERLKGVGFIRRLKSEVLTQLPEKTIQIIPLSSVKQSQIKAIIEATDDEEMPLATLRRLIGEAKAGAVVEHVLEVMESDGRPVVIFAHHRNVIERIAAEIRKKGYTSDVLYGGMSSDEKQIIVDKFQGGKIDALVASITAAGVGITLTRARIAIFAELDWTPANVFQAEDRIHRIGQKDNVLIQYIVIPGTIDEKVAEALYRKEADILKFIGLSDRKYLTNTVA